MVNKHAPCTPCIYGEESRSDSIKLTNRPSLKGAAPGGGLSEAASRTDLYGLLWEVVNQAGGRKMNEVLPALPLSLPGH